MARKSIPSSNPIRVIRLQNNKSLEEFSQECKVHLQAVYLNEMGMYPTVLPSILRIIQKNYGYSATDIEQQYESYVQQQRYDFGQKHSPYILNEPIVGLNPLHDFRNSLGYHTAFGFAKAICINPTTIRRVEKCMVDVLPGQLKLALRDIQLPVGDIEELEIRHQEYFHSGARFKVKSA